MKKVLLVLALALASAPALAGPYIDIPAGEVNFDGNGEFTQLPIGGFDASGPMPLAIGTELYGVGTVSGVAMVADLGSPVWLPSNVGPSFEMTYSFWDAVVTASGRIIIADPMHGGHTLVYVTASYSDEAKFVFVSDTSKDYSAAAGPGAFDLATGDYPTAYTLPAGGAAVDTDESLYLSLDLYENSSVVVWSSYLAGLGGSPLAGFLSGSFSAAFVEITGGYGAGHFMDFPGFDGAGDALVHIWRFSPTAPTWLYGADTDIQLTAVPEPAALMSLCAGLALLGGYALRRRS